MERDKEREGREERKENKEGGRGKQRGKGGGDGRRKIEKGRVSPFFQLNQWRFVVRTPTRLQATHRICTKPITLVRLYSYLKAVSPCHLYN